MRDNIVFIEGVGYCEEVTINRYNENGILESYCEYIPVTINKSK